MWLGARDLLFAALGRCQCRRPQPELSTLGFAPLRIGGFRDLGLQAWGLGIRVEALDRGVYRFGFGCSDFRSFGPWGWGEGGGEGGGRRCRVPNVRVCPGFWGFGAWGAGLGQLTGVADSFEKFWVMVYSKTLQ